MALKDEIKLDKTNLDEVALRLPTLYDEWGTQWVNATRERDKIKERLSVVRAQADEEIRKSPKDFGWDSDKSPTEAWVAQQIILHDKVKEANEELIEAQYEVNMMSVAKETIEHTRRALEILTDLWKGSYFSARSRESSSYNEALKKSEEDQADHSTRRSRSNRYKE